MSQLITLLCILVAVGSSLAQDCQSRDYGHGSTVCVCNAEYCDTIPRPQQIHANEYLIYTSNKAGLRFQKTLGEFGTQNGTNQIRIDRSKTMHKIIGWGGSFTDSTGININSLEEAVQAKLLESYFGENGIEYNTCRVPIGGTDFSTHGYSYNDGDPDPELNNFALAEEDLTLKIPCINKAKELNDNLQLFASAWTAPKWMKTNGEYAGLGYLKAEMYQSWATYFVKFLDAYKEQNIDFWGLTTGNEPNTIYVPGNKINIVGWIPSEMGKWIANNLGPTIRNSSHSEIKILVFDDNRITLPEFVDIALEDPLSKDYIDGIALHWYENFIPPTVLDVLHEHFPEKFMLSTEACNAIHIGTEVVDLGSWERGEYYTLDIIENLEHYVSGWVDWNMVLDLNGGPTYIENFVDAPVIVNATAGEFYKQPMYYHLGHFSKFVPRDSVVIGLEMAEELENIYTAAFLKPDDGVVVVLMNRNEESVVLTVIDDSKGNIEVELSERSIVTILF